MKYNVNYTLLHTIHSVSSFLHHFDFVQGKFCRLYVFNNSFRHCFSIGFTNLHDHYLPREVQILEGVEYFAMEIDNHLRDGIDFFTTRENIPGLFVDS